MIRQILGAYCLLVGTLLLAPTLEAQTVKFTTDTPTVDTSAYASGDLVGALNTITDFCRPGSSVEIRGITVYDKAGQGIDIDVAFFNANPTGTTFTDNAAFDPADADLDKITIVPLTTHKGFSDNGITQAEGISYQIECASDRGAIYWVIVSRGAPTYATAADVSVRFRFFINTP